MPRSICYHKIKGRYVPAKSRTKRRRTRTRRRGTRHLYRRPAYQGMHGGETRGCPFCGKKCKIGHTCPTGDALRTRSRRKGRLRRRTGACALCGRRGCHYRMYGTKKVWYCGMH